MARFQAFEPTKAKLPEPGTLLRTFTVVGLFAPSQEDENPWDASFLKQVEAAGAQPAAQQARDAAVERRVIIEDDWPPERAESEKATASAGITILAVIAGKHDDLYRPAWDLGSEPAVPE